MKLRNRLGFLALIYSIVAPPWALAATITVGPGGPTPACSFPDAIAAANGDVATGSCPTGSGADTIVLTGDVTLTAVNNFGFGGGANGLPRIMQDLTIEGAGYAVRRDMAAPDFRIFDMGGTAGLQVVLEDLTIENGRVASAGGIVMSGGTLTLRRCTVRGNVGTSLGGGIYLSSGGDLIMADSTLSGNSSGLSGGIYINTGSTIDVTNSTLSGNSGGGFGGGIFVNTGGAGVVKSSTLSGNTANTGSGIHNTGALTIENTIVAGSPGGGNCTGSNPVVDAGGNFDDDGTCGAGVGSITPGVDFDTVLASNGGPTQTHALLAGSVAIDAAGACGLAADQRGFPRDAACDSGAYEFAASVPDSSGPGLSTLGVALLLALATVVGRFGRAPSAASHRS